MSNKNSTFLKNNYYFGLTVSNVTKLRDTGPKSDISLIYI